MPNAGHRSGKLRLKRTLDIILALLLPCLMAYDMIGQAAHEILGLCMTGLLVLHHALNRRWYKALFKGRYTPYKAALTAADALMLIIFAAQVVCGIMMAQYVFPNMPHVGRFSIARTIHLACAYWGFALASLHAGLHMTGLCRKWLRLNGIQKAAGGLTVAAAAAYGVAAFIRRGWHRYMTLSEQFVFFDYGEPLALFFADALAIMLAFMLLGCLAGTLLQGIGRRNIS